MANTWIMTEQVAADRRMAFESAADRQRLAHSTQPTPDRTRRWHLHRQSRASCTPAIAGLRHQGA